MLVLALLLAFLVRLIALNQSLWLDEATTARVLQQFNFLQIVSQFAPYDFHPPLYYLFLKLWTSFFGYSEIALRMPSVLFSLGAGWFVYLIGAKLKNEKAGLWAVVFFLFNPLIVYYSQEARMYMMVTFLLTGALYFLIKLLDTQFMTRKGALPSIYKVPSLQKLILSLYLFNLFVFLAFLTFYGSVFLIATIYLYLLVQKQFRLLLLLLPGFILAILLVSPLLIQQYINSRNQLTLVANWTNVLGTVNLKNFLLIPLKFSIGRISWEPKAVYYAVGGLWTMFVILAAAKNLIKSDPSLAFGGFRITLGVLFIVPLILGAIFSIFSPLLQYFRFLYLVPLMSLLIATGADRKWQKIALLIGFSAFSSVYLLNPNFHREDWKSLTGSLSKRQKVYMIPSSADPLRYYNPEVTVVDIRKENIKDKKIVVIPHTTDIYGFNYKNKLQDKGFSQQKIQSFRGLTFEVWSKKEF